MRASSETSRRALLVGLAASALALHPRRANAAPAILVHKDPSCSCCTGWVGYLRKAGFEVTVGESENLAAIRRRLAVPDRLVACHTAVVDGYVIEGHVPVGAVQRLLTERPDAVGLAVPGMPVGSPGMEGPKQAPYDVILFGAAGQRKFMRFIGTEAVG
ncbi:DUF411 domain-containing protein [Bradyrhizobium betae]